MRKSDPHPSTQEQQMTTTTPERKPGTVTYEATISPDETGDPQVSIYRYIVAGICGPAESAPLTDGDDLTAVAETLRTLGYDVTGSWQVTRSYEGIWLVAQVTRR